MISVIIPNYNTPKEWLCKSIASALEQQYSDIEVIVVDDGSDEPFSGLDKDLNDKRIQWINTKNNSGVSTARNYGANKAKGKWLAFLDADDWWEPDKLALQMEVIRNENVQWVYTSAYLTTQEGETVSTIEAKYKGYILEYLLADMVIAGSCSGVMIDKSLFLNLSGFDINSDVVEDWDMWIRLAKVSNVSFVHKPLVYIRSNSFKSRGFNSGKLDRLKGLWKKHWEDVVKYNLQDVTKSHFFSVKAKLDINSKKYVTALWDALLSIFYSKDLSKFSRAYEWTKYYLLSKQSQKKDN